MGIIYENLILDIYLINRIPPRGNTFVAKMFYLFEDELFKKKMIGPRYKMLKDYYGPYDITIRDDMEALAYKSFFEITPYYVKKRDEVFNIYKKNEASGNFLKSIDDLIQENSIIFNHFDKIIDEFGNYSGRKLKEYVYSLKNTGIKNKKIDDYSLCEVILDPSLIENPIHVFELDEIWFDSIEVLLNPNILSGLKKGISDAQEGKFVLPNSKTI